MQIRGCRVSDALAATLEVTGSRPAQGLCVIYEMIILSNLNSLPHSRI